MKEMGKRIFLFCFVFWNNQKAQVNWGVYGINNNNNNNNDDDDVGCGGGGGGGCV